MVTIQRGTRGVSTNVGAVLAEVTATTSPRPTALAILTPVDRPEWEVRLNMLGASVTEGPQPRWTEVERPRRQNVLRYDGKGVRRQSFQVMFSGALNRTTGELADVTSEVVAMLRLLGERGGDEPPVLRIAGPLYGIGPDDRWQLQSAVLAGEPWRRASDGRTCQVTYDVTLVQFLFTDVLVQKVLPPSPAAASNDRADAAAAAAGAPPAPAAGRTYTVRKGDNLTKIAAAQLGNGSRWRELAQLNALRDPNRIYPGQVLKLP